MSSIKIGSKQWFEDVLKNPKQLYNGGLMMVDGMNYHASKYFELENQISNLWNSSSSRDSEEQRNFKSRIIREMKYELIAYLNQMGRFYYFVKGNNVIEKIGDSSEQIPTINKFMIFRHKQAAHRGSDAPKDEDPGLILQLDEYFMDSYVLKEGKLMMPLTQYKDNINIGNKNLILSEEHEKIKVESERVLSDLLLQSNI